MITSLIKLQVPRAFGGHGVHNAPNIIDGSTPPLVRNDNLLPWDSSINLFPGDLLAGDPAARNQGKVDGDDVKPVLVNMADFGDDLDIE